MLGGNGADLLRGWPGADRLFGGPDGDRLSGGPDGDLVVGNRGHDVLKGKGGIDFLRAKDGFHDLKINCGPGRTAPRAPRATSAWTRAPAPAEPRLASSRAGDHARVQRIHYRFGIVLALILVAVTFTLAAPRGRRRRASSRWSSRPLCWSRRSSRRARLHWVIRLSVIAAMLGIVGAAAALFGTGAVRQQLRRRSSPCSTCCLTPPAIVTGRDQAVPRGGQAVTMQTMFGVLCLYLLIGLIFGVAFATIEEISAHAVLHRTRARTAETTSSTSATRP